MPGLLSSGEAASIRDALGQFLTHTCTVTPVTNGAVNAYGDATRLDGTPVENVACKYRPSDRVRVDEQGGMILRAPTLKVAHDLSVSVGDKVSAIADSTGVVLLDGPARVEAIVHSAGLGPTLGKRLVLSAEVTS